MTKSKWLYSFARLHAHADSERQCFMPLLLMRRQPCCSELYLSYMWPIYTENDNYKLQLEKMI